jgi:hypothetical protein
VRGEDSSNMPTIPSQNRVTQQIIRLWQPFHDLKQTFEVSRRANFGFARSNAFSQLQRTLS